MRFVMLRGGINRMVDVYTQRQMLQWITALEKAAASSHYTGTNRFDSFAPIRLNVAAQWLVDGVSDISFFPSPDAHAV